MKVLPATALFLATLILQGCAAVVIGSAAVATKTATDPRSLGTQMDDGTLEIRVSHALSKDQQLKKEAHIVATVYQGKVLLTGQVPDNALASRAEQIAAAVAGVTEVYNEIRQGKKVSAGTASQDIWITTKIRSQLLRSAKVKSSNIKVTTENGEVFLLGVVTENEEKAATDIASRTGGVRHVTTALTILK